jgi:transcriptional regulator with XRE-family HTH domain
VARLRQQRSSEEAAAFKGLGLALIEQRKKRELSAAKLAGEAGMSPTALRAIERGESEARWGTLRRLAEALELPLHALFEKADELAPGSGRAARRGGRD